MKLLNNIINFNPDSLGLYSRMAYLGTYLANDNVEVHFRDYIMVKRSRGVLGIVIQDELEQEPYFKDSDFVIKENKIIFKIDKKVDQEAIDIIEIEKRGERIGSLHTKQENLLKVTEDRLRAINQYRKDWSNIETEYAQLNDKDNIEIKDKESKKDKEKDQIKKDSIQNEINSIKEQIQKRDQVTIKIKSDTVIIDQEEEELKKAKQSIIKEIEKLNKLIQYAIKNQ